MKFEEFLKENRERIRHDAPKTEMWNQIEDRVAQDRSSIKNMSWLKIASVLIVLLGVLVVFRNYRSDEVDSKKSPSLKIQMAKLAKGEKTSQRIMAVNMLDETQIADQEIIQILIERMQLDESKNVRLAAVRALTKYIDNENVRVAMLNELVTVKDHYLQLKLIAALKSYKENEGSQHWDNLLENKSKENALFEYGIKDL